MCGGIPFRNGVGGEDPPEVVGLEVERLPAVPVMPDAASASWMRSRIPSAVMGRFSRPMARWNSSGIGGFQVHSCES